MFVPLLLLLALFAGSPAPAYGAGAAATSDSLRGWTAPVPETPGEDETGRNWMDEGHAAVTNSAQALSQWMDEFFGDPTHDLDDDAESKLRLQFIDDWESGRGGHDFTVRLRGKVQLPRISRRLNLVFAGEGEEDPDDLEDDRVNDDIGLQYSLRESDRARFDTTLSVSSMNIKPGLRFRQRAPWRDERFSHRFVQRLQWDPNDRTYATTRFDLNFRQDEDNVWRWTNRTIYGEESDGLEWRSRLALRQRHFKDSDRPMALEYYTTINGVTDPDAYVRNYRFGVLMRRQVYRDYLFVELEPAWNFRRDTIDESRDGVWSITVRFEFALRRDLVRRRERVGSSADAMAALP